MQKEPLFSITELRLLRLADTVEDESSADKCKVYRKSEESKQKRLEWQRKHRAKAKNAKDMPKTKL